MRALICVDAQNDFMPNGALPVTEGDKIVSIINGIRDKFDVVVFTQDWHPTGHCSFVEQGGPWPIHCVASSLGARLHKDLIVKDGAADLDMFLYKGTNVDVDSYSGFWDNERKTNTGLADRLRDRNVDEVYICGLATDYCVKFTALDAVDAKIKTTLILDACRGVNVNPGDVDKAIDEMRAAGITIINSDKV